jgi:hypothetical protein
MSVPPLRRKYLALLRRARDQEGTPEGELCKKIASRMKERYDLDAEDLPVQWQEVRYKAPFEHELLIQIGEYLGCSMYRLRGGRRKVLTFESDAPTAEVVVFTFETLRGRLEQIVKYAAIGFIQGALPLSSEHYSETSEPLDEDQIAAAKAGLEAGRRNRVRKAIWDGS